MTRATFGYVYGGTVTYQGKVREIDGTAWSLAQCDEAKLRATAMRDLSRSENVPLEDIQIVSFRFSEFITDDKGSPVEHPCADPFRPREAPMPDAVDPFRPAE